MLEIEAPEPGKYDTSHSFQISGLKIRTHDFKSIKSRLRVSSHNSLQSEDAFSSW